MVWGYDKDAAALRLIEMFLASDKFSPAEREAFISYENALLPGDLLECLISEAAYSRFALPDDFLRELIEWAESWGDTETLGDLETIKGFSAPAAE